MAAPHKAKMKLPKIMLLAAVAMGLAGCQKSADSTAILSQAVSPEAEVRAAILAHLAQTGTLNLQAFDTDITQVTFQGDRAQAQVDFHVKNGSGAMQLTYQLEKRDGGWAVVESNPAGSDFSHPPLGQGQAPATGDASGTSHSLSDTLRSFKSGAAAATPNRPPGHPPINSNSAPSATPQ